MRVLNVRNVQEALPRAVQLIQQIGVRRESRNGPVLFGGPVTTCYSRPTEMVLFWPERDANPFLHLYESLWMLKGRNDVAPLLRYAKQMSLYSDDGVTLHGAYGYRWREHFSFDQLREIAKTLTANPEDRRCVLQMWDAYVDGGAGGKDYPCNTIATFQRGVGGELNLTVFCRSNDIVWGAYGANAVQFGTLLEYMACWIGCPIGYYEQVSVNWHGYINTMEPVKDLMPDNMGWVYNPYESESVRPMPMVFDTAMGGIAPLNRSITELLNDADCGFIDDVGPSKMDAPWAHMVYNVLLAHHVYKSHGDSPKRFAAALEILDRVDHNNDWASAARQWIMRRADRFARLDPMNF